jgi:hypothetical protein
LRGFGESVVIKAETNETALIAATKKTPKQFRDANGSWNQ